ncbi:autotransporter domain-containing protein [uncultured Microbulbifer sp.]|uniref:autotransporter outer membrane beta-barrel domain-containing protein n=1 Tax=uncultured Microbulbifer sp. TaxID=348147 RepID=UPI002638CC49|nr:autotransporter domain-containing protein [uncultured Microbulbifer sp.]
MPNAKRSLAAAIALTTITSAFAFAEESAFTQVIAFGDSLTDVGNYDVFTSGGDNREAAISILSQNLGLGAVNPSCAGLSLCLPDIDLTDPNLSQEALLAAAQAQVIAAVPNVGTGWAVGGHKAADVLMNIVGTKKYFEYLETKGLAYDPNKHNFASALLPDPTRETETGLYPDLEQLGYVLKAIDDPATSAQLRATAAQFAAAGDTDSANFYYELADKIDAAPATLIAGSGTTGNPHPLGLGYLESTLGSVDPRALYWVNGGGNDLLNGFASVAAGTTTPEAFSADIDLASTMLADAAGALSNAGANYILVSNVPDISKTPASYALASQKAASELGAAVAAGLITQEEADAQLPAAIDTILAQANAAAETFNTNLLATARDIDGVLMVDQAGLLKVILDNAGLLGLSGEVEQNRFCYDGSGGACIEHPVYGISQETADADQLIFNDGVHPTQVGQQVLADYYTAIVNAAQVAGQLPDIGAQSAHMHLNSLEENLAGVRYSQAQTGIFVGSVFGNIDYDNGFAADISGDSNTSLIGLTYALRDNAALGFALSRSNIDLDNARSDIESTSTHYSLFGRLHHDIFFVEGSATLTDVDYDQVNRALVLGDSFKSELKGETSGENLALSLTAGANLLSNSSFQFGPFVGVTRSTVEIDGYTEDAIEGFTYTNLGGAELDPLGIRYGDQERRYTTLRFGAFANKSWSTINAYAQVWYQDTTGTEEDTLEIGVKSLEGNMSAMPSYSSADQGLFEEDMGLVAGIRWQAAESLALGASVTSRPTTQSASLNVTYHF